MILRLKKLSFILAITFGVIPGCRGKDSAASKSTTAFSGADAPYRIETNRPWKQVEPEPLNPHADLALAHRGRDFYVIVLPQRMSHLEGYPLPTSKHFHRVAIKKAQKQIQAFYRQKSGAIEIDGQTAIAVMGESNLSKSPLQYVLVHLTHGGWGYQIIAWGPLKQREGLISDVEAVLKGWQFEKLTTEATKQPPENSSENDSSPEDFDVQSPPDLSSPEKSEK